MDKVIYVAEKDGRKFFVMQRQLFDKSWLSGYMTVNKREYRNARKSYVSFIGRAYEIGIGLDERVVGVDTADPADNWMTVQDVIKELEEIIPLLNDEKKVGLGK